MSNSSKVIKDYLDHVNSIEYSKFLSRNPAGTTWTQYCNDFKANVIYTFQGKTKKQILNLLMQSGAINSPTSFPDEKTSKLAFKWHLARVSKAYKLKDYFPEVEESNFINGNCIYEINDGRIFSLDTFRYLEYLKKINNNLCNTRKIERYLEIGSGNGGFARTLKLINPTLKITLIDLPEVLFCSRIFLEETFPDNKHFFITSIDDLKLPEIKSADFLYLSHSLFKDWSQLEIKIDLFCNMRSIGEMPMHVTSQYINILKNIEIENIFLENRFLNGYSPLYRKLLNFRKNEITGSTWMEDNWKTIDFDYEPIWTRSPYEADHPRYLSLCMKGKKSKKEFDKIKSEEIIENIKKQTWFQKYYQLKPWNIAPKTISRDCPTLKNLWEINRNNPTPKSLKLIIDFIAYYFDSENVEEIDFYKLILKNKFKTSHRSIIKFKFKILLKLTAKILKNRFLRTFMKKSLSQVIKK